MSNRSDDAQSAPSAAITIAMPGSKIASPDPESLPGTDIQPDLLKFLMSAAPVGIALLDHDLRYVVINQLMADMNGFPFQEHLGKPLSEVVPHLAPQIEQIANRVLKTRQPVTGVEITGETAAYPSKQRVWLVNHYPFPGLKHGPGIALTVEDITERKLSEVRLLESEFRWRRLMDANVVGIVIADTERVIDVNQRFLDMVGYRYEELVGQLRRVTLTPVEFAALDESARQQLRTVGAVAPFEKQFVRRDGNRVPVLITGTRLQESPLSWVAFIVDLTQQKEAQRQIRESELRWRRLAESSIAGILIANQERVLQANKAYLDIIGYTDEELREGRILRAELTPSEYQSLDLRALEQLRQTGQTTAYEKEYQRRDGSRVPVLLVATRLSDVPLTWVGLVLDLTDQKRTETALRQREEQVRALTRAAPVFLFSFHRNGECEYASEYYYEYTGRPGGSAAGAGWLQSIEPEDARRISVQWESARQSGQTFDVEYRLRRVDGVYRWFKATVIDIRNSRGDIVRWYGGSIDIHDQKEIQAALQDADRRKDEFLAMLAHELRNPLAPIVNALEVIRRLEQGEPRLRRALDIIERQSRQLTNIVDELLEVSRITIGKITLHKEVVEIGNMLTQALETARPLMEARNHRVEVILPNEPMQVEGDQARLTQALLNLLNNAAKYTPEHGNIRIQAAREGEQIVLQVCDNGYGMAPELLPHVFDLFTQAERTLDRADGGLGIGLTIARRLVELHGGSITASSSGPGLGSKFEIHLPRLAPSNQERNASLPAATARKLDNRRVLVVDDNIDYTETMAELLGICGFEVAIARDGNSALEIARNFEPHAILLDIGLPGFDGYEVAQRMVAMFGEKKPLLIASVAMARRATVRVPGRLDLTTIWSNPSAMRSS